MRLSIVLLLMATALLANTDAASGSMDSKMTTRGFTSRTRSLRSDRYKVHTTRLLRSNEDQDFEERAISAGEVIKQAAKAQMLKVADSVRVRSWLRDGKTAEATFKRLKLNKGVDMVLSNKKLSTWFTYVKLYNKKHPKKMITRSEMLTKTYGDQAVANMLEIARDVPSTNQVATKLLTQMGDTWWRNKKSADDVFGMLNLDKAGPINLLSRREFNTWYTYASSLSPNPRPSMIDVLTQRLGADKLARFFATANPQDPELKVLAVKLQSTMLLDWERKGLSSDEVFRLLKLDDGVEKVFANPILEVWMGYVSMFSGGSSQIQLTAMVKNFDAIYDSEAVARMLEAARRMENTKDLATKLQKTQFRLWRRELRSPMLISRMFNADNEVDDAIRSAYSAMYR